MKTNKALLERVEFLINLAQKSIETEFKTEDSLFIYHLVSNESFKEFETASLSFIFSLYGESHPYYLKFKDSVNNNKLNSVKEGKGILKSIKNEIENGWLNTYKGLVSAEIFIDILESAEYLLDQKYKNPAAVLIGSILEEHLRQLCNKYKFPIEENISGKPKLKKADAFNNELYTNGVYNKLDQKNITAWLDLRNKAAHGLYDEFNQEQVENMLRGIMEFMTRNAL